MTTLEYVASGTSHIKLNHSIVSASSELVDLNNSYFESLNDKNNHKFSLLFNAFIERSFGEIFKNNYSNHVHSIHADSGGLQIITQGKTVTSELKNEIYKTQAKYSDVAMCFDEIPITTSSKSSGRNDTLNKFFDKENLEYCAKETGKNIKRQIEVVLEENSTTKPMLISQGNCYDSYMKWVECVLSEIPTDYHKHIGGIAMGAAALGTGFLEDIERAAYATKLPFQMKEPHIHILGVGSIRRLMPYIALSRSGYYPSNLHISYDSTTHTAGANMGLFYSKEGTVQFNRVFSNDYVKMYNDINSKYNIADKGVDVRTFHTILNSNTSYYKNESTEVIDNNKMLMYHNTIMAYVSSSISNFTSRINSILESEESFMDLSIKNKIILEMQYIANNVKTLDDFNYWRKIYGSDTKSNRIKTSSANIESFFS